MHYLNKTCAINSEYQFKLKKGCLKIAQEIMLSQGK